MVFLKASIPLTPSDIERAEKELDVFFPLEFVEHYLRYNGGLPEKDKFIWQDGGKTRINCFSSIKDAGFVSLEETYRDLIILESYLPIGIIPFGTDDGGNSFCISARKEDHGFVYYCNDDHYNTENKEECLTLIDKSFKHFIDNLSG
ncbi:SMI1/KNR4 family protein [Flavitalea sp. BT771]|uniref:SMI1/KNR4 family protein n=1 Tax=Flavitalea sp. BT771 TaxID=3063329 RepID=UPI0026E132B4|nr:SMI1/KNR4 family protein [Flavitalea sp. BT771]MDO6429025.1 SMI1/KNR4 family protein [Flavitalea sp. BT771]MDV6218847.1 SMI1/KNR4 family protein [Flavitalea sp. BT771]